MKFCSVITRSFLPHARVLGRSIAAHHPVYELCVLVADADDEPAQADEPFRRVRFAELPLSLAELNRRRTMYSAGELLSSLRGALISACLDRGGRPVIYLDVDMIVLAPLDDLFVLTARHGILLTPHATTPQRYQAGGYGPEQNFIRAGVFNGACLGVAATATDFLIWRDQRVARDCVIAPERALFLGQSWLALVPALFDHLVLRDRGINLSSHALGDDDLDWRDDRPWIGRTPVRLFHFFGGFDPRAGGIVGSRGAEPWVREVNERPGLAKLSQLYGERLLDAGFDQRASNPEDLNWAKRRAFREALIAAEAAGSPEPPNPFSDGMAAFTGWLAEPAWPRSEVSRFVAAMWAGRPDLRAAFPRVPGADEAGLLAWVASKYQGRMPSELPVAATSM